MEAMLGRWSLVASENFNEFLTELGVGLVTRTLVTSSMFSAVADLSKDGDYWVAKSESIFKNFEIRFKLNEEADGISPDGRKVKNRFFKEGDKIVQIEKTIGGHGKETRFERFIEDGKLVVVMVCNGVKAKRTYEKI